MTNCNRNVIIVSQFYNNFTKRANYSLVIYVHLKCNVILLNFAILPFFQNSWAVRYFSDNHRLRHHLNVCTLVIRRLIPYELLTVTKRIQWKHYVRFVMTTRCWEIDKFTSSTIFPLLIASWSDCCDVASDLNNGPMLTCPQPVFVLSTFWHNELLLLPGPPTRIEFDFWMFASLQ